ncbi:MAG: ATP-binding protein [Cyanobacteria bacterium J06598_1]
MLLQASLEETVQQSESAEAIELYVKRSEQTLEKQKRLLARTRETLLEARMVPLSTVLKQFPPTVERLKNQHQKPVDISLEGGDILVDKAILDNLYEPLLHLVRNAFDHGIESPEERLEQNKSLAGKITVKGTQRGRYLILSVEDDGRGLDLAGIRQKAIESQLIDAVQAETLTNEQTTDLLFEPGFSTAIATNALSGRGVGLDAVRARVRSLQGWITLTHQSGGGTCFTLQIPASLTIAQLLLCQSQGRIYALIADAVEHILIPTDQQVRTWKGGKMLTWQTSDEEHLVPVNGLDEVLHYASSMSKHRPDYRANYAGSQGVSKGRNAKSGSAKSGGAASPVILLNYQNTLVGLEVDQLLGEQELVISPLGETIVPPAYLYGSSILPDGQLTLVLDGLVLGKIVVQQRQKHLQAGASSSGTKPSKPVKDQPTI